MEIVYKAPDESIEIKLVYITSRRKLKYYKAYGKAWPRITQCLMFYNGLIVGFGEVVKHQSDVDNVEFAMRLATKRVLSKLPSKLLRTDIWKLVLNETRKS